MSCGSQRRCVLLLASAPPAGSGSCSSTGVAACFILIGRGAQGAGPLGCFCMLRARCCMCCMSPSHCT